MKIKSTLGVLILTSIFINFAYAEVETTNTSNETTAKQPSEAQDAALCKEQGKPANCNQMKGVGLVE